jgi:hypothetical protein
MRMRYLLLTIFLLGLALPCHAQELDAGTTPSAEAATASAASIEPAESAENAGDPGHDDPAETPIAQSFVGDAWADDEAPLKLGLFSFRVLLQTRYDQTFAATSSNPNPNLALRENVLVRDGDGFSLQRFFFRIAAVPNQYIAFKSILDLSKLKGSNVSNVLKQAFMQLSPVPKRVELVAGVFKLPYSILELDPVARFEVPNLGQADDLIKNVGFAGRDVGVELMFAPLPKPRWLHVIFGAFRGHAKDEHASPFGALGARLESKPIKGLRFGADIVGMPASQDYKQPFATSRNDVLPLPPDPLYPREQRWGSGVAYSADVSYSRKKLSLRVEGMLGDRVDIDERYGARAFWAAWGIVAYRFKLGAWGLMPAARVEWLDMDANHSNGGKLELTGALNVLYGKRVRFVIAATRTEVQASTPVLEQPRPLPYVPYFALDNTRLTFQLQLEI